MVNLTLQAFFALFGLKLYAFCRQQETGQEKATKNILQNVKAITCRKFHVIQASF